MDSDGIDRTCIARRHTIAHSLVLVRLGDRAAAASKRKMLQKRALDGLSLEFVLLVVQRAVQPQQVRKRLQIWVRRVIYKCFRARNVLNSCRRDEQSKSGREF